MTGEDWAASILIFSVLCVSIYIPYERYQESKKEEVKPIILDIKSYEKGNVAGIIKFDKEVWDEINLSEYESIFESDFGVEVSKLKKIKKKVIYVREKIENEESADKIRKAEKVIKESEKIIEDTRTRMEEINEDIEEEMLYINVETIGIMGEKDGDFYVESRVGKEDVISILLVGSDKIDNVKVPNHNRREMMVDYIGAKDMNMIRGGYEDIPVYKYIPEKEIETKKEEVNEKIKKQIRIKEEAKLLKKELQSKINSNYADKVENLMLDVKKDIDYSNI